HVVSSLRCSLPCFPLLFFFTPPPPPSANLFPYTTLFRSRRPRHEVSDLGVVNHVLVPVGDHGAALVPLAAPDDVHSLGEERVRGDRKSTRLNSSHVKISYAVFCLKKKNIRCNSTYYR